MFTKTDQAPQWLLSSWLRSCVAAGATANEAELISACRCLLDYWSGPEREDEVLSGAFARQQLMELGVPAETADRVSFLVSNLVRHKPVQTDEDSAVLNDADLAILKSDPQLYKQYLLEIRSEYAHIPVLDFVRTRLRIVAKLLERPNLFTTAGAASWEDAARQNLIGEQARLERELSRLELEVSR